LSFVAITFYVVVVVVDFVIDSVRKLLDTPSYGSEVKGKFVPVLPLTEHHAMKAYWGVEVQLHPFSDLGTTVRKYGS
jgi:hypothetical protein